MTSRERFLKTINFERPSDRLPIVEWAAWWDATIDRWKREGLPPDLDWEGQLKYFGLDTLMCIGAGTRGPDCPSPDHHGAGLIADEASYEELLPHLYPPSSIEALLGQARNLRERHERGEIIIRVWLDGFFWWPRTLLGIEKHLYAFFDQPALMHRLNRDMAAYHLRTLDALLPIIIPDMVGLAEDMSYNNGPMLSREMFDEFLLPYYRLIVPAIKARGVKVMVDTDGQLEAMIPWLLDAGVEGVYPLERQSGVDVSRIRRNHPRFIMMGGYDKMVMSKSEADMREEFERLLPVMKCGGFVPSVDNQTPPGVSLDNYRCYVRLLKEYAEKAVR